MKATTLEVTDHRAPSTASLSVLTSESVTEGHPDKVADLIADRLLDAYLVHDPNAHVAIEVLVKNGSTSRGNREPYDTFVQSQQRL